jgi:phosphoserine aminotransferase
MESKSRRNKQSKTSMREETKENMRKIRNIEDEYGLLVFRGGLTQLVDVGVRNLNEKSVEEDVKKIMTQGKLDEANGKASFIAPEIQCEILRCAAELSKFSIWTLFRYIKEYVVVDN